MRYALRIQAQSRDPRILSRNNAAGFDGQVCEATITYPHDKRLVGVDVVIGSFRETPTLMDRELHNANGECIDEVVQTPADMTFMGRFKTRAMRDRECIVK